MNPAPLFLGDIPTQWSKVFQAKESQGSVAVSARRDLLLRYSPGYPNVFSQGAF
jgi:hypothetical protein